MKYKSKIVVMSLIITFTLVLVVTEVYAYLTDEIQISGTIKIEIMNGKSTAEINLQDNLYKVTAKNSGTVESYVRIKIFSPIELTLQANEWTKGGDGYYYYNYSIMPEEITRELICEINKESISEEANIVTVQETTPARYNEKGEPYADWTTYGEI